MAETRQGKRILRPTNPKTQKERRTTQGQTFIEVAERLSDEAT
jgi:hypothetical protein